MKKKVNQDLPSEDLTGDVSDAVYFEDFANITAKLAVKETGNSELDITEKSKAIEQVREVLSQ